MNAIAPAARTRMTESTPGLSDIVSAPKDESAFDVWDPANVSPLVAYLATESCPMNGKVFFVQGGKVQQFQPWTMNRRARAQRRWTIEELARRGSWRSPGRRARYPRQTWGPGSGFERAGDPDQLTLGTPHGEELAVVPWPILIRERIQRRARSSDRYSWWVLAVVLAGLLSSNVFFTVFVVALPSVAAGLHTSVATITWVVTAPMLAVAVAVPLAGQAERPVGSPPLLPDRHGRERRGRRPLRARPRRRLADRRRGARGRGRCRPRGLVDGSRAQPLRLAATG